MIPVYQTILRPPRGNCLAACVASIFEVSLADVPNYVSTEWWEHWETWLAQYGIQPIMFTPENPHKWPIHYPKSFVIAGVQSPRGDFLHAVVTRKGRVVHDPWPGPGSLKNTRPALKDYTLFVPLDPAKPMFIPRTGQFARIHTPEDDEATIDLPVLAAG